MQGQNFILKFKEEENNSDQSSLKGEKNMGEQDVRGLN